MKKIILGIVALVVIIQFISPTKNVSNNETNSISTIMEVPVEVQKIIKTSCADCHSNLTVYPWYSKIAPVSWYLASHVNEGKEHLNFSEWTSYNANQKKHIKDDIENELEDHKMPLKSYLIIHKDAEMTSEQYQTLLNWVKTIKVE